ncbi:MAG: trigger factor [Planctomycetaceae bacterium]|nr:trigger factor [Planctomycetaceae bacterium]
MSNSPEAGSPETSAVAVEEKPAYKLSLAVKVEKTGPCKRHVTVTVPRKDLDYYFDTQIKELVKNAVVPGFRAGHVPRKLVEKRFRTDVEGQVCQKILIDSLEQLATENDLNAINEPDLNIRDLKIPEKGDFEYNFNVEVAPEFDLPSYTGLTINRPVREITEQEIDTHLDRLRYSFSENRPVDRPVEAGDAVLVDIIIKIGDELLGRYMDRTVVVKPTLAFRDAQLQDFDTLIAGTQPGDTRVGGAVVGNEVADKELRGVTVEVEFHVLGVFERVAPEVNTEFLAKMESESVESLRKEIRETLERQIKHHQRQSARIQVLGQITGSGEWELPESLVRRQVENAMRREMLELHQAGYTMEEITVRENELRQKAISTTRQALKEHFVLDRIAEERKLTVEPIEIDVEIALMAHQQGESPRKIRAYLEKQNMIENLSAQILERKAVDVILDAATYVDVDLPIDEFVSGTTEGVAIEVCGRRSGDPEAGQ